MKPIMLSAPQALVLFMMVYRVSMPPDGIGFNSLSYLAVISSNNMFGLSTSMTRDNYYMMISMF